MAAPPAPDDAQQKGLAVPKSPDPRFEKDVLPILQAHCTRCHGSKSRKAELNLTSREGVWQGSESGPVIVPGKVDESSLWKVLREGRMPPDKKNPLSRAEMETVRRWIETASPPSRAPRTAARRAVAAVTDQDIVPLVLLHCVACHGARVKEGGLDLRSRAGMLKGGKSGPALVPGHPERSLMLTKVQAGEMPPFLQIMKANVKPLSASETERLTRWIAAGAPAARTESNTEALGPDPVVTDKDRTFWSFRPPAAVSVPAVRDARRAGNPVDAFLQKELENHGLGLGPEADPLTLVRRAYLDLTGLLPEPDRIQAFLADRDPGAYQRLIDRLLASPRYSERWGRYWLDLAGYADSDGHFSDAVRPFAYRYRDYVIRSLNADKPYDRFLIEQIAGDELADYEHASAITPEIMDNLVATGFLRMAPDGTNPTELNSVSERLDVIADEIEVFSSAVLGLTVQCARCHDHKYDPIPQPRLLSLGGCFQGGLRRIRLAEALRASLAAPHGRRDSQAARP